jgi:hypothetical protein
MVNVPIETGIAIINIAVGKLFLGKFSFNNLMIEDHNTDCAKPFINQRNFKKPNATSPNMGNAKFVKAEKISAVKIAILPLYLLQSNPFTT